MAKEAEKRGLPHELPVMASLVESGLKNVQGGDRDSVGFFQMRLGIWNNGPYAGYPDKPELQIKWFLDQAEAVKKQRIARGQPIDDPKQYGEWIADVERPAEQFRGRYQLRLDEATVAAQAGARDARRAARGGGRGARWRARPRRGRGRRGRAAAGARHRGPRRRRSPRSRRPRSTSARRTSTAARRRRPASTAPA